MKEKKFKVFVTDGEKIKEVFFITVGSNGDFYFGPIISNFPVKYSRHVSGEIHLKFEANREEKMHSLDGRTKLTDFEGVEQLTPYVLPIEIFGKVHQKNYEGGKCDGSAFIDVRNYGQSIAISPFLLEPGHVQQLEYLNGWWPEATQIIIFTQTTPWIVLIVSDYVAKKA